MAVEAALTALGDDGGGSLDLVCFASTTPPYAEKSSAAVLAAVLDCGPAVSVADLGGSLRAGTTALRLALDSVRARSAREALVAAADVRLAPPGSDVEAVWGDGAAAVRVGRGGDKRPCGRPVSDPRGIRVWACRMTSPGSIEFSSEPTATSALVAGATRFARATGVARERFVDVGSDTGALTSAWPSSSALTRCRRRPVRPFVAQCVRTSPARTSGYAPAEALPVADPEPALAQIVGASRSGCRGRGDRAHAGGLAACVWESTGGMTMLRAYWDSAREVAPKATGGSGGSAAGRGSSRPCGTGARDGTDSRSRPSPHVPTDSGNRSSMAPRGRSERTSHRWRGEPRDAAWGASAARFPGRPVRADRTRLVRGWHHLAFRGRMGDGGAGAGRADRQRWRAPPRFTFARHVGVWSV